MTSTPPPWQPGGPVPSAARRVQIGRKPAIIGMAVAGLVGILLGGAARSADASGPGPTSTVTVTQPAATVTVHSTSTVTARVTSTVVSRVTSTKTVAAAAAHPAPTVSSAPATSSAPAQDCTPGYSPCIPPGPDVDCAGGSGNGPRYVQGPVYVTGNDPYGLDSDHDGVGCE
ncbi:MAG TPA: hypothetical protein VH298_02015 [Jatrophihabitans sp.]|jgi:hypothetical protein|nr:hypothetical protein [Jatrophihabitans sp.]